MQPLADKALKALEDGQLRIIPDRFEKVLSPSSLIFSSLNLVIDEVSRKRALSFLTYLNRVELDLKSL